MYLCWRDAPQPDGDREQEALRETVKQLHSELDPGCPDITKVAWKTNASPTDHAAIRSFAEHALRRVRDENPGARIVIHLSPGTPAMHAVWLALGTTGFIEGPVELIQTADARGRAAGQAPVQTVRFDVDTWLRRYRASHPRKAGVEDDGHVWDPGTDEEPSAPRGAFEARGVGSTARSVFLIGERGTGKTTLSRTSCEP